MVAGGTNRPWTPSRATDPLLGVVTTKHPAAIAIATTRADPSAKDGNTNTSARLISAASSRMRTVACQVTRVSRRNFDQSTDTVVVIAPMV